MTDTSEAEARFAQHPPCPSCGAKRTQRAVFGMPVSEEEFRNAPPWVDWRGCCVMPDIWTCSVCKYRWA